MLRRFMTAALLLTLLCAVQQAEAKRPQKGVIRVASYNIRGDLARDHATVNAWQKRKDSLYKVIRRHDFDIVAMQEVVASQMEDIEKALDYEFVCARGLFNPILFKRERFELLHAEIFWLNETMEPYAKGWDAKYDRYCLWVALRERKTGREFCIFNTHLDHRGAVAKREAAALISREALKHGEGRAIFICGDMNSFDTTDCYAAYTRHFADSRRIAKIVEGPEGTAHNFGKVKPVRIDYIFVNDKVEVMRYEADDEKYPNGMYPSDHLPIFIDVKLKK